jgi:hypothetical protein
MATKGGSGILNPPGDEDVAPVIPLRQRQTDPVAPTAPRKALPRENAAFDPELEPADVALRRRRSRRALRGIAAVAPGRVRPARATVAWLVIAGLAVALGVLARQSFNSGTPHASPAAGARRARTSTLPLLAPDRSVTSPLSAQTSQASASRETNRGRTGAQSRSQRQTRQRLAHHSRTRPSHSKPADHAPAATSPSQTRTTGTSPSSQTATSPASSEPTASPPSNSTAATTPPSTASSSGHAAASTRQPAFGAKGTLGPGHSPDS